MLIAAHLLQNPSITTVLLLAADCASRITDPTDRTTGVFFGDAAAAVVLTRADTPGAGLLSYNLGSQLSYDVQIPAGGSRLPASSATVAAGDHYLSMDGRAVWNAATTRLPESITCAADRRRRADRPDPALLPAPGQFEHSHGGHGRPGRSP